MELSAIESCYDRIARAQARTEEVGPFTLFVADPDIGRPLYARPRLGLRAEVTADDVRRVLARQADLGVPRAIEWVDEVTPSLLPAVRAAVTGGHELELCPLLALPEGTRVEDPGGRVRILGADDPDLSLAVGAVSAGFRDTDEIRPRDPGARRRLIRDGLLVTAAAYDEAGRVVGGGSAAPRGDAAELMGIAVLPHARRRGLGAALTAALVRACRSTGVSTVHLSAASDDAAGVYRSAGFRTVGRAGILEVAAG